MFRSLSELSEINPNFQCPSNVEPSDLVSFIPMGDVSDSGQWVIKRTKPLKTVRQGFTPFSNGDVLFAKITPCMENGKGAHVDNLKNGIGFGSTEFHVLRPKPGVGVDERFIFQHTQHQAFRAAAEASMTGSAGQKRVPTEFFHKWKVYSPVKEEQSKIAQILDTLDTQIQKTEALIAKLDKIKEGLLHDLLTRGVDQNGQLRPMPEQAQELYKESALGLIPKEWEVDRLTARAALPKGQVSPLLSPYKKMVLVAPDHIETGTARLISKETAEEQNAISGKYLFAAGDVLYSKIRPYLRKAILADFGGLCSADMYPLRPSDETCPRFLLSVVLGHHFSRFAESVSMRSGFPKINRAELAEFSTAWPPLNEQRQISSCLASAESKTAAELEALCKLEDLKKGLMDDLLSGQVRVTPLLKDAV